MKRIIRNTGLAILLCMILTGFAGVISAAADEPIQHVHTIYWKARITTDVVKKHKKVLTSGSEVVVVNRAYRSGKKSIVRYDGGTVKVPNGCLNYICDLCTAEKEGDYNLTTKLWYVNVKRKLKSKTNYLIWVSLDKQRVNVFKGSAGNWELVRAIKCSTGLPDSPSKAGLHKCDFKELWYRGCNFYVEYSGSGIHKWVKSDYKDIGKLGKHTASQSCIRLKRGQAKWLYNLIPVNTTILVW